jgi:hypothetical protein
VQVSDKTTGVILFMLMKDLETSFTILSLSLCSNLGGLIKQPVVIMITLMVNICIFCHSKKSSVFHNRILWRYGRSECVIGKFRIPPPLLIKVCFSPLIRSFISRKHGEGMTRGDLEMDAFVWVHQTSWLNVYLGLVKTTTDCKPIWKCLIFGLF